MTELPRGTVTLVFTDIEGSTRVLQELGERYDDVLEHHRRLIREAAAGHAGVVVDVQGDGFLLAFERASDAVDAFDRAWAEARLLSEEQAVALGLEAR